MPRSLCRDVPADDLDCGVYTPARRSHQAGLACCFEALEKAGIFSLRDPLEDDVYISHYLLDNAPARLYRPAGLSGNSI